MGKPLREILTSIAYFFHRINSEFFFVVENFPKIIKKFVEFGSKKKRMPNDPITSTTSLHK